MASDSNTHGELPRCLACPITGRLMAEPVTDREGYTYEREAIVAWLTQHGTSPVTRNRLAAADLKPNRGIQEAADDWYWLHSSRGVGAKVATDEEATPNGAIDVALTVGPRDELCTVDNDATLLVTITPPVDASSSHAMERLPCDLVCVIDVSGSMSDEAVAKDAAGTTERTGLCMLDVVKHAVLTIGELMGPQDRLALVPFSSNATAGQFRAMDDAGRAAMKTELMAFRPSGSTNLWDGIVTGMRVAKESARNCSVFVLTDGQPTTTPAGGYVEAMKAHVQQHKPTFTLSTFGFGYNINTAVLDGVAQEGRGTFAFIPDSGLVGTIFVNAAANLLTTCATAVRVTVAVPKDLQPVDSELAAGVTYNATRSALTVDMGTMQYGQPRHLALHLCRVAKPSRESAATFSTTAKLRVAGETRAITGAVSANKSLTAAMHVQLSRTAFAAAMATLTANERAEKTVKAVSEEIAARRDASAPCATRTKALFDGLLEDLASEISMGIDADNFGRWGCHYFRSIAAANNREQCNNFKDKSVQCYGGQLFVRLQADGERAFLALPPPVATYTAGSSSYSYSGSTAAAPASPVNMNWAYNCSGGCIAPSALVTLASGAEKPADEVRKGDVLAGGAVVECVVRVRVQGGRMDFALLDGGLLVSPFHPVRINGAWHFPATAPTLKQYPVSMQTDAMYSFTLAAPSVEQLADAAALPCVRAHGVDVAPIAHRCGDGIPVIGHAFFGADDGSLASLKASPAYGTGAVEVASFQRDPVTRSIIGLTLA